jgi:hypothetical protein
MVAEVASLAFVGGRCCIFTTANQRLAFAGGAFGDCRLDDGCVSEGITFGSLDTGTAAGFSSWTILFLRLDTVVRSGVSSAIKLAIWLRFAGGSLWSFLVRQWYSNHRLDLYGSRKRGDLGCFDEDASSWFFFWRWDVNTRCRRCSKYAVTALESRYTFIGYTTTEGVESTGVALSTVVVRNERLKSLDVLVQNFKASG